jgi:hypothetical protein
MRGVACVNPANSDDVSAVSTASHVWNARVTAAWSCWADTPGAARSVTK